MEELIQRFENLRIILTPSVLIIFIIFGISKERDRPVKYVPSWNPWIGKTIVKIKEGPPWLVIFTLIGMVATIMLFAIFTLCGRRLY